MEDETIIDLYFAREERAIAETGRKYGGYCRSIAFNILHSREDALRVICPLRAGKRPARRSAAAGRRSCCFPNFPTVCRAANGPRRGSTRRPSR